VSTEQEIKNEFDEACRRFLKEAWVFQLRYCDTVCKKREGCPVLEALKKEMELKLKESMPYLQVSVLCVVDHLTHECTGISIGQKTFLMQMIMEELIGA